MENEAMMIRRCIQRSFSSVSDPGMSGFLGIAASSSHSHPVDLCDALVDQFGENFSPAFESEIAVRGSPPGIGFSDEFDL
jgi:hypothetical protein